MGFIRNTSVDLELTLIGSAQCFSWVKSGETFEAVLNGRPVRLRQAGDGIEYEGIGEAELRRYLDLDRDYAAIAREFSDYPPFRRAMELYPGLQVLRQDPWEATLSFILSANNNVARITRLVQGLCRAFGPECGGLWGFPSPETLAAVPEESLRALGMGYRAPYIKETARRVAEGFPLDDLADMEYDEAHRLLVSLPGVGDKVADCILLFGCGHTSAFPVDVWVERLLKEWFGITAANRKKLALEARARFGPHAGLMQQFLFHAARTGDISTESGAKPA